MSINHIAAQFRRDTTPIALDSVLTSCRQCSVMIVETGVYAPARHMQSLKDDPVLFDMHLKSLKKHTSLSCTTRDTFAQLCLPEMTGAESGQGHVELRLPLRTQGAFAHSIPIHKQVPCSSGCSEDPSNPRESHLYNEHSSLSHFTALVMHLSYFLHALVLGLTAVAFAKPIPADGERSKFC